MRTVEWIDTMLKGGQLKRFHAFPIISHETVAEHSFGVAMLVMALTEDQNCTCSIRLLKAALFHDIAEQATGDVPAVVKWKHPLLKAMLETMEETFNNQWGLDCELREDEKLVLKWADMLHLLLFCKQQRELGNRGMNQVFANGVDYLSGLAPNEKGQAILRWIIETYNA